MSKSFVLSSVPSIPGIYLPDRRREHGGAQMRHCSGHALWDITWPCWQQKAVTRHWGAAVLPLFQGSVLPVLGPGSPEGTTALAGIACAQHQLWMPAAILTAGWGDGCHLHSWLFQTRKKVLRYQQREKLKGFVQE